VSEHRPAADHDVLIGRSYTRARRYPLVISKIPAGPGHPPITLPLGPYSITQAVAFVAGIYLLARTYRIWITAGWAGGLLALSLLVGLVWALGRARIEGRSASAAALGLAAHLGSPLYGQVRGRGWRDPRPTLLTGVVHLSAATTTTPATTTPAGTPAAGSGGAVTVGSADGPLPRRSASPVVGRPAARVRPDSTRPVSARASAPTAATRPPGRPVSGLQRLLAAQPAAAAAGPFTVEAAGPGHAAVSVEGLPPAGLPPVIATSGTDTGTTLPQLSEALPPRSAPLPPVSEDESHERRQSAADPVPASVGAGEDPDRRTRPAASGGGRAA
jgi:hypothetical protein